MKSSAVKIKLDLSTFDIRTSPPPLYEPFHLSLDGKTISDNNPRTGVIKLFNNFGITLKNDENIDKQLAEIIEKQPPSYGRRLLLCILNPTINQSTPTTLSTPDENSQDQSDTLDNPPVYLDTEETIVTATEVPEIDNVTGNSAPLKPPYRKKGRVNIFDPIIDSEIKKGGSSREISKRLLDKGIIISHMSINRRFKEQKCN